jgi:hypothetical protein
VQLILPAWVAPVKQIFNPTGAAEHTGGCENISIELHPNLHWFSEGIFDARYAISAPEMHFVSKYPNSNLTSKSFYI